MAAYAFQGDRNIIKFDGDHNSPRPQCYFDSINIFFQNVLQPPEDELGESFFDFTNDFFGKVNSPFSSSAPLCSEYKTSIPKHFC